ncbi:hypothetical protein RO31_0404 [Francisella tularensis subsp. tularensis str. SCHU S4 substr. NR-28534]|nr:hypothetical protein RO31_0404 [Francisella tularensis subsp. tularensis str. SCHU S4 substr. NR-28534]
MKSILVNDEEQMYQLAKEYSQQLKPGQIIYLYGDLGAGKNYVCQRYTQCTWLYW